MGPGGPGGPGPGPHGSASAVLICYNLPRERVGAPEVFNLFCPYGHVARVRLMREPRNAALVQLGDPLQAREAREALNRTPGFGGTVTVDFSYKHATLRADGAGQITVAGTPAAAAAAALSAGGCEDGPTPFAVVDFEKDALQRYAAGRPGPSPRQIFRPSSSLYFANLPENTPEERVHAALRERGCTAMPRGGLDFLPAGDAGKHQGRRSGFLHFATVTDAFECLVVANHCSVDGAPLRLSFSNARNAGGDGGGERGGRGGRGERHRSRSRERHPTQPRAAAAAAVSVAASAPASSSPPAPAPVSAPAPASAPAPDAGAAPAAPAAE
jgi:hypothetical protein